MDEKVNGMKSRMNGNMTNATMANPVPVSIVSVSTNAAVPNMETIRLEYLSGMEKAIRFFVVGKSYRVSVATMFGERGATLVGKFLGFSHGKDGAWSTEDMVSQLYGDRFFRSIDLDATLRFLPESVVPNGDGDDEVNECDIKVGKEYWLGWYKLFPSRW